MIETNQVVPLALIYIFFVVLPLSVLLHEIGHQLAFLWCGRKVERCIVGRYNSRVLFAKTLFGTKYIFTTTFFLGGGVTISSEVSKLSEKEIKVVAIAGPLVNFGLLIGFSLLFWMESQKMPLQFNNYHIFYFTAIIMNLFLFVVNMLPLRSKPTDGALLFHTAKMHSVLVKMNECKING